jgi:predicted phosphodiesterase
MIMKLAVISDIHGNMESLSAVLSDIGQIKADEIVCLGDNIGYGAESETVVSRLHERNIVSISGNHELAVCCPSRLVDFNPLARISLSKIADKLTAEAAARIYEYPMVLLKGIYRFVHGFPPDSPDAYLSMVSEKTLKAAFQCFTEKICFVGHTHELELVSWDGQTIKRRGLGQETVTLNPVSRYIVNVGSVGQPRDSTYHAKYVVWDESVRALTIRFVDYDAETAAEKILAAGLPRRHALRLLPTR